MPPHFCSLEMLLINGLVIACYSIQNWIEDLYWKQLDINYPGMPDTMVCANGVIKTFLLYVFP